MRTVEINPIMLFALIILSVILGGLIWKHNCARGYYESGAHAIAIYHKYRGTYGSRTYRDFAFKWGDPQDEEDLEEIERLMRHPF